MRTYIYIPNIYIQKVKISAYDQGPRSGSTLCSVGCASRQWTCLRHCSDSKKCTCLYIMFTRVIPPLHFFMKIEIWHRIFMAAVCSVWEINVHGVPQRRYNRGYATFLICFRVSIIGWKQNKNKMTKTATESKSLYFPHQTISIHVSTSFYKSCNESEIFRTEIQPGKY